MLKERFIMKTKHLFEQLEINIVNFSEKNLPTLRNVYVGGKAWHNNQEYTILGINAMAEIMLSVQLPLEQIGIFKRSELSTIIPKADI